MMLRDARRGGGIAMRLWSCSRDLSAWCGAAGRLQTQHEPGPVPPLATIASPSGRGIASIAAGLPLSSGAAPEMVLPPDAAADRHDVSAGGPRAEGSSTSVVRRVPLPGDGAMTAKDPPAMKPLAFIAHCGSMRRAAARPPGYRARCSMSWMKGLRRTIRSLAD